WSVFTAVTAVCFDFYSLLVVRFLFGAGEAGALPNAARIVARWYPASERGRVQGLIQTAALVGGTAAPVAAAYLIRGVGWRGALTRSRPAGWRRWCWPAAPSAPCRAAAWTTPCAAPARRTCAAGWRRAPSWRPPASSGWGCCASRRAPWRPAPRCPACPP